MRSQRRNVQDDASATQRLRSESASPPSPRGPRRVEWLIAALALLSGGCLAPCSSGVCNTQGSLFSLPTARYNGTERVIDNGCAQTGCDSGSDFRSCKSKPYPTFNKYCPWFDEWHTTATARRCANRILNRQQWQLKKLMPADYKMGFRQAFVDVAHGSDGELPAVAPSVYWNTHFRNESGQRRAECWFAGYRAGAAAAAVQLAPLKRVAASYDWTIEKPNGPIGGGECVPCGLMGQADNRLLQRAGYRPGPGRPSPLVSGQPFPQGQPFPPGQPLPPGQFGPHGQPMGPPMMAPGPVQSLPAQPQPIPVQPPPVPNQPLHQPGSGAALPGHSFGPPSYSGAPAPAQTTAPVRNGGPGLIGPPEERAASPANTAPRGGSLLPGFSASPGGGVPAGGGSDNWTPPEGVVY